MHRQGTGSEEVGPLEDAAGTALSPVAVVAALKRLLDSDELRASVRSRDFLAYVVSETLAGRAERLKERTVARYALGRGGNFDTTTNATARVQANRLRASMERYYAGSGAEEPLVIELPRGSYVPTFSFLERPRAPHGAVSLLPGIAVVQFADLRAADRNDPVPRALTDALVHSLNTFADLRIVGPVVTERGPDALVDARAVARSFDAEYVLAGAVRSSADVLRLTIRLCDGATGDVLWSEHYDGERSGLPGFADEDDLVGRIAATVGDVRGVVRREVEKHPVDDAGPAGQRALLAFYRYAASGTKADTDAALAALLVALEDEPDSVPLLTMAGWMHCVLGIMGWTEARPEAIASAERLAGRALTLDPANPQAHQVLAGVALFRGLTDQCRSHALRTVELSPVNSSLLYTSGVLLLQVDDWEAGIELIRRANRLNPYHPGFHHIFLGMDRLFAGDDAGALAELSLVRHPEDVWGPLLRSLALAGLGFEDGARQELEAALALEPALLVDDAALVTDGFRDAPYAARAELRRRLVEWTQSPSGTLPGAAGDAGQQPGSAAKA